MEDINVSHVPKDYNTKIGANVCPLVTSFILPSVLIIILDAPCPTMVPGGRWGLGGLSDDKEQVIIIFHSGGHSYGIPNKSFIHKITYSGTYLYTMI